MPRLHVITAWIVCMLAGMALHVTGGMVWADRQWLDHGWRLLRTHAPRPVDSDVVIVGIDEAFLHEAREPLALLHRHYAELFEALAAGQPKVVGLDIVLPDKSFAFLAPVDEPGLDFDRTLARGLLRLGQASAIVVAQTWDHARGRFREIHPTFLAASSQWARLRGAENFDHRSSALVCADGDGTVREYPGRACQPSAKAIPLAARMTTLLGRDDAGEGFINFAIGAPFTYIAGRDLIAWHKAGNTEKLAALKRKTVLVGAILDAEDRFLVPVELAQWEPGSHKAPGVALQAQIVRSLLNQGLVRPAPWPSVLLLIGLGASILFGQRLRWKITLFALFCVAIPVVSLLSLHENVFLPPAAALTTATLAILTSGALAGRRYWRERQYLRKTFMGSVSPQVLRSILAGRLKPGTSGQKRHICVLFSDIRDFTTLSENLPADAVVSLLNRYFERMAHIVHRHGGSVDKFIGDGMMAFFGEPQPLPHPEKNAFAAAQDMLRALDEFNARSRQLGLPDLGIGIGIHSGDAVVGYLGSHERHEYTAIGDAVNVAARVCDLPKKLGFPVICTETVAAALAYPPFLVAAGEQPLKGHSAMRVYGWSPCAPTTDETTDRKS